MRWLSCPPTLSFKLSAQDRIATVVMSESVLHRDCVVADRGGIVENRHYIHATIVDSNGKLLYSVGNPGRTTLLRSAAKPAQALAVLETAAFDRYGYDEADLALACASHNSEEVHLSRARSMLEKINASEAELQCGGHPSISPELNEHWIRNNLELTPIYNNCSGKHVSMLAGTRALDVTIEGYHTLEHPMQQGVKRTVEQLCDASEEDVQWAIDGCNLPAPAMPLHNMARMYANLAGAADAIQAKTATSETLRTQNTARVFNAMAFHPHLVGGSGRFCTELMQAFSGTLIGKVGADGCYGIGIRASEQTRRLGAQGAVGIAIKVEDGSVQIVYAAVVEILTQLNIGTEKERKKLERFHHPPRLNTMNVVVGKFEHSFCIRGGL